jgi:hypothetical protein
MGKIDVITYKYIYNYIIEHSLLYSYQSGLLPGHSIVYQLLEIYHNICKNIDNRKEGMTLVNFQSDGNLQVRKEYLNRILRGKHIVSEVEYR